MIDESVPVSESVIFIANISVIGISIILHIGAPLLSSTNVFSHQWCARVLYSRAYFEWLQHLAILNKLI